MSTDCSNNKYRIDILFWLGHDVACYFHLLLGHEKLVGRHVSNEHVDRGSFTGVSGMGLDGMSGHGVDASILERIEPKGQGALLGGDCHTGFGKDRGRPAAGEVENKRDQIAIVLVELERWGSSSQKNGTGMRTGIASRGPQGSDF